MNTNMESASSVDTSPLIKEDDACRYVNLRCPPKSLLDVPRRATKVAMIFRDALILIICTLRVHDEQNERYSSGSSCTRKEMGRYSVGSPRRRWSCPSSFPSYSSQYSSGNESTARWTAAPDTASSDVEHSSLIANSGEELLRYGLQVPALHDPTSTSTNPPSYEDAMSTPSPTHPPMSPSYGERCNTCDQRTPLSNPAYLPFVASLKIDRSVRLQRSIPGRRNHVHAS
ncbi:hypothetical protein SCHPADRAFT_226950 [Schizopora paradoxa]|uniref:Uncharacterized protein n=1 Tax=Schizopora paradoxa TaxID=27342 RepID=A0A0H2RVZ6_9AGAM|nr:hypothetical protein SCHPADRAFT_226950 [Schizopora paradoxa]